MWLSSIVMATLQKYNELRDPLYSAAIDTNHFHVRSNFHLLFLSLKSCDSEMIFYI